jgi:CheY-like chemotaxis protein
VKSIALIEDNKDNRLLVRALLEGYYILKDYETGFEAMEGLKSFTPDLILLDISLPGMDGVEVLTRIRSEERLRSIPIVALTAHAMSGDRERYLAAGFDEYVPKPIVEEEELLQTIARLLDHPRQS